MAPSEEVHQVPTTIVTIYCLRRGRLRPGIPRKLQEHSKAPAELSMVDLQEQGWKLIEDYGLPLRNFVLLVDAEGSKVEVESGNTSKLLATLCAKSQELIPSIFVELVLETGSEESAEDYELQLESLRKLLAEAHQQRDAAQQQCAVLQEEAETKQRRIEAELKAASAASTDCAREMEAATWVPISLSVAVASYVLLKQGQLQTVLVVVLVAVLFWRLQCTQKAEKLFIVVDGNLSSTKGPFLRHLRHVLGPDGVQVTLRSDDYWADKLIGLYKCTKDPGSTGGPEGEQWKAMAWILQRLMMTNDMLEMYKLRSQHTIVEQSLWSGEFVFRPTHHALNILTGAQLEECTERFCKAVQDRGLPSLFLRLCVKPQKALQRIRKKNHPSEQDVELDYLEALERRFADYKAAIAARGGTVIELMVDKEDGSTAEPSKLMQELRDQLRKMQCPRVGELRRLFRV